MKIVLVNPAGEESYQGDKSTKVEQYMYPYSVIYLQNYLLRMGLKQNCLIYLTQILLS